MSSSQAEAVLLCAASVAPCLDSIKRRLTAAELRVSRELTFSVNRQRAYHLLHALLSSTPEHDDEQARCVTVAHVSAFVPDCVEDVSLLVLSHPDPLVDVIGLAARVTLSPGGLAAEFGSAPPALDASSSLAHGGANVMSATSMMSTLHLTGGRSVLRSAAQAPPRLLVSTTPAAVRLCLQLVEKYRMLPLSVPSSPRAHGAREAGGVDAALARGAVPATSPTANGLDSLGDMRMTRAPASVGNAVHTMSRSGAWGAGSLLRSTSMGSSGGGGGGGGEGRSFSTTGGRGGSSSGKPHKETVDMAQLAAFVFPPRELHPRTTGRLIVYALYGPLAHDGLLYGGRGGERALSEREIDSMVDDIEAEDAHAAFQAGRKVYSRGRVVALPVAGGAVLPGGLQRAVGAARALPNLSRPQFDAMFMDLPRDEAGFVAFHDVQQRILDARAAHVAGSRKMFPDLVRSAADAAAARLHFPTTTRGTFVTTGSYAGEGGTRRLQGAADVRLCSTIAAGRIIAAGGGDVGGGSGAARSGRSKSARPPSALQSYREHERCMHTLSNTVVELGDMRHASEAVAANVRLVRADKRAAAVDRYPVPPFDITAPYALQPRAGSYVLGASIGSAYKR